MDKYIFDKCSLCDKYSVLKNNRCLDCTEKLEIPEFLKDLFKKDDND